MSAFADTLAHKDGVFAARRDDRKFWAGELVNRMVTAVEGYSQKQAVAIALSAARVSWRRRNVRGPYPAHLRRRPKV